MTLITLSELCTLLRVKRSAINRGIQAGNIPRSIRMSGRLLWDQDAVIAAIKKQQNQ